MCRDDTMVARALRSEIDASVSTFFLKSFRRGREREMRSRYVKKSRVLL